jgi:tryptophan-rich sensory protein
MLDRIEEMVEAACTIKHPELLQAMNIYVRRATSIVQQAMLLQGDKAKYNYRYLNLVASTAASLLLIPYLPLWPTLGGTATFGIYKGNNSIIYMRENY